MRRQNLWLCSKFVIKIHSIVKEDSSSHMFGFCIDPLQKASKITVPWYHEKKGYFTILPASTVQLALHWHNKLDTLTSAQEHIFTSLENVLPSWYNVGLGKT